MKYYEERNGKVLINLPYGEKFLSFELPKKNLLGVLIPKETPGASSKEEIRKKVVEALNNPIGTKKLPELTKKGDKVVIVADDITRPTPTDKLIPPLLDELNKAGIPDEDITIVVALGTHRYMTDEEMELKFGREVLERVEVINHEWKDPRNLVYVGSSSKGTPIIVNKIVYEADFKIGVGNITWNDEVNNYNDVRTTRLTKKYQLMRAPVKSGSVIMTYYWIDIPKGEYAQRYNGNLYIMINTTW